MPEASRKFKTFIIHLQRAKGRKAQVGDLTDKSPFDVEIVDAVDGALLSDNEIKTCYTDAPFLEPTYPFGLNAGEIGCFLSHRRAWQKIVDQDLAAGLVFEDDVYVEPEVFNAALEAARTWTERFGFIQFQVRSAASDSLEVARGQGCKLLCPVPSLLRTSAQLVSHAAAKRLLDVTQTFDRPVDGLLQMHWITGVQPVCVSPSGVFDRTQETGGSTLSVKQPLVKKLGRELKRACYKAQIRKYSRRNAGKIK
ncbi:MAG: glycosyltransferase family 25 protein [Rhodobacterales bacterium]